MKRIALRPVYKKIALFVTVILLLLLLPSPISQAYAEFWATTTFQAAQAGIVDGCGFKCVGCGVKESHKTHWGYLVRLEYACGLIPTDAPEFHSTQTVFVSFLGTVHAPP